MSNHSKKIIYTALFGERGRLHDPKVVPKGWDFICFTDRDDLQSSIWDIRVVGPHYEDSTRNARMYKVLPHRFLAEYNISIWHDANISIKKNPNKLMQDFLKDHNFATFDHRYNQDSMECVYEESANLLRLEDIGRRKDDPELIKRQVQKYREERYPEKNGLAVTQVLLRRHNEPDVVETMEKWWSEIEENSKRDQMSFNYAAWKTGLRFAYLPGDSRKNEWFKYNPHKKHPLFRRLRIWVKKSF